jgi:hypothetical protein
MDLSTVFRERDYGTEEAAFQEARRLHDAEIAAGNRAYLTPIHNARGGIWAYRVDVEDRLNLTDVRLAV